MAGEASGDLHGALLVRELQKRRPDFFFFGLGGDQMHEQGVRLAYHVRALSVMGFFEVVRRIGFFRKVFREVLRAVEQQKPTAAVLIDYPGFNLRLAKALKARGIPVIYYIAPQIWAWRPQRIKQIKRFVDLMLVILPFEEELYRTNGVSVRFVGHPLVDQVRPSGTREGFRQKWNLAPDRPLLGLLPGSRPQEVAHHLPVMLKAAALLARQGVTCQPVIGLAPTINRLMVDEILRSAGRDPKSNSTYRVVEQATYDLMCYAKLLVVSSGTATVEAALAGTPMVVLYKTSPFTYLLARRMVRIPRIAMVNVLAREELVPEFIQKQATPEAVGQAMVQLWQDEVRYRRIQERLAEVKASLGNPGAAGRAAEAILSHLSL